MCNRKVISGKFSLIDIFNRAFVLVCGLEPLVSEGIYGAAVRIPVTSPNIHIVDNVIYVER